MTQATREENRLRLNALVETLKERGVVDIKLDIAKDACFDDKLRDTVEVLQAVVDKRFKPLEPLGDSVRNCC